MAINECKTKNKINSKQLTTNEETKIKTKKSTAIKIVISQQ